MTVQPMEFPLISKDSTRATKTNEDEPSAEKGIPLRQDTGAERQEESQETEESPLQPLPQERVIKQPTITSFFTKSLKKQAAQTSIEQSATKEPKGKEMVVDTKSK